MRTTLLCLLLIPALGWAEPATIIRTTELKQAPATDAPTVAELAPTTLVDALERRGGWTRIKAQAGEGWVKMLALRYGASGPGQRGGNSGLAQLFNVARTGSSGTQVTTGVRGLDAEQIANASPNAGELKKMQGFAVTAEAAAKFAMQGRLKPVAVEEPQ